MTETTTSVKNPVPVVHHERRQFLKQAGQLLLGAGVLSSLPAVVWADGSDKPEKTEVNVGFIPLTDCASVVMAHELGLDEKYGIKIVLSKESSWARVSDKLINGQLDAAHVLYGLLYGVHMGISGPQTDMANLMTINRNGQAITLAKAFAGKNVSDAASLAALIKREPREYTFSHTYSTGTHAMWLNYWLASAGINPLTDVKTLAISPAQVIASLRQGGLDGCCVGEPWNEQAIKDGTGFTVTTSQAIWPDHPEKILGTTAHWVALYPNTARALVAAVLEASHYLDDMNNRAKAADTLADERYINVDESIISERLQGHYNNGAGKRWDDDHYMKFCDNGAVNFPYLSDGMWFLTQHKRWGLLSMHPDYLAVATKVNQIDLYKQAAELVKLPIPKEVLRSSTLMDGKVWDGLTPEVYADQFAIKA